MSYQKTKKRLFEIIQASTEHDLASKVFDICLGRDIEGRKEFCMTGNLV